MRIARRSRRLLALFFTAAAIITGCGTVPPPADPQQILDYYDAYRFSRGVWSFLPADHPDRVAAQEAVPAWIRDRRRRQADDSRPPAPPRPPSSREAGRVALQRLTQPNCLSPCPVDRTTSPVQPAPDLSYVTDADTGAAVALFQIEDVIYVVFRGTRDGWPGSLDRAHNLMIELDPIPFAPDRRHLAHRGFLLRYLAIRDPLWEALAGQLQTTTTATIPREIRATGHSAGGAAALLFAYDATTRTPLSVPLTVAGFGAPRTLNRAATQAFASTAASIVVHRVTNRGDVVPSMPPALFGYRHVGDQVQLGTPPLFGISFRAHHPGYRDELRALLLASRADLSLSHSSWLQIRQWSPWPCGWP